MWQSSQGLRQRCVSLHSSGGSSSSRVLGGLSVCAAAAAAVAAAAGARPRGSSRGCPVGLLLSAAGAAVLPTSIAGLLQTQSSSGHWRGQGLGCENRLGTSLRWVGSVFSSSTFLCTFLLFLLQNVAKKGGGLECHVMGAAKVSTLLHCPCVCLLLSSRGHNGAQCVACSC